MWRLAITALLAASAAAKFCYSQCDATQALCGSCTVVVQGDCDVCTNMATYSAVTLCADNHTFVSFGAGCSQTTSAFLDAGIPPLCTTVGGILPSGISVTVCPNSAPTPTPTPTPTPAPLPNCTISQLGDDINGPAGTDFGNANAISANGMRFAVSEQYGYLNTTFFPGSVTTYEWVGNAWQQLAPAIFGVQDYEDFGVSIQFSDDGNRLAIGAPSKDDPTTPGSATVYAWTGSAWQQLGSRLIGDNNGDRCGNAISISGDGLRLAVSCTTYSFSTGRVKIYNWNGVDWAQLGSNLDGANTATVFGNGISLSNNGSRIAIGIPREDNVGTDSGAVAIYEWDGSAWQLVGAKINGEIAGDFSGTSVSLSADGKKVAIGSPQNDNSGNAAGDVRVFEWDGSVWQLLGTSINGEAAGDLSGTYVSLAADGSRVAISASGNDGVNGSNSGHLRVYDWNGYSWQQVNGDLDGRATNDNFGRGSLSRNGRRLAGSTLIVPYARVYDIDCGEVMPTPSPTPTPTVFAVCGNNVTEGTEQCDNGLDNNNYGDCKEDCTLNTCGDGWLNRDGAVPEQCDDGNAIDTLCSSDCNIQCTCDITIDSCVFGNLCQISTCNSGTCGPPISSRVCSDDSDCTSTCGCEPVCGDGITNGAEECDDGNNVAGDGCNNCIQECTTCALAATNCSLTGSECDKNCVGPLKCLFNGDQPSCVTLGATCTQICDGGSCLRSGESCSADSDCPTALCSGVCAAGSVNEGACVSNAECSNGPCQCPPVCGNNITEAGETCDDGNIFSGDGCSSTCQTEQVCGDLVVQSPEQCDSTDPCCVDCMYAVEGIACDDATLCNGNETCNAVGVCQAGTTLNCNDNNQCTTDSCDPVLGCLNTPVTDGTSCSDGLFCTDPDTCVNGLCTTPARDCADSIDCTVDACDETNDVCLHNATDSLCPSTSCRTGRCSATSGCYTVYNPTGNCVRSQGYYKNHYSEFTSVVNITYNNYICYSPATTKPKVAAIDPLYWWNQPVKGSAWIQAATQYYAAVGNYYSTVTNKCCLPALCSVTDYFANPELVDCFYFVQSALKTAFPCTNCITPPACNTKPKLASTVDLARLSSCTTLLDSFNKGQGGIVPYCNGYGLASEATTTASDENDNLTLDEELDIAMLTFLIIGAVALVAIAGAIYYVLCGKANYMRTVAGKVDYNTHIRTTLTGNKVFL